MDWHQSVAARQLKDVSDYMCGDCVLSSNWAAALMFSVKHQQQRSRRVQPARPSLGVGRGADAKTEAGGERLVHPGAATVQLPATVRLKNLTRLCLMFISVQQSICTKRFSCVCLIWKVSWSLRLFDLQSGVMDLEQWRMCGFTCARSCTRLSDYVWFIVMAQWQ